MQGARAKLVRRYLRAIATQQIAAECVSQRDTPFSRVNLQCGQVPDARSTALLTDDLSIVIPAVSPTSTSAAPVKKSRRVTRPAGGPSGLTESAPAERITLPVTRPAFLWAEQPARADTGSAAPASKAASPASDAGSITKPATEPRKRHAATALVFQAPDITPRPSRRAQAPAGPPRVREPEAEKPQSIEATGREQVEKASRYATKTASSGGHSSATGQANTSSHGKKTKTAKETTKASTSTRTKAEATTGSKTAPASRNYAETSGRTKAEHTSSAQYEHATRTHTEHATRPHAEQASRTQPKSGSHPKAEPETSVEVALTVEPEKPRLLTKAENTAAKEVAAIEAELENDIASFAPEDLVVDTEDVEIDAGRRRRRRGGRGRRPSGKSYSDQGEFGDDSPESSEIADDGEFVSETDAIEVVRSPEATKRAARADSAVELMVSEAEGSSDAESPDGTEISETAEAEAAASRRRRRRGTKADRADRLDSRTGDINDEVTALKGSTRLEAKRQRRREGRATGRRRQIITEAEFLARRENVDRKMVVRQHDGRTQVAVLEDGILVEHYVAAQAQTSLIGNIYMGRVQNVLPSMEAAFVDIGRGRNAVLYAGEVNWDAAGLEAPNMRRIESALKSGDSVLVQVTKDPIGQKGARLTSQITLAGRYLVLVPGGGMTGISRKLPEVERYRLKRLLREIVPEGFGVIVRTAAAGASEDELRNDVDRLKVQWDNISAQADKPSPSAPALLQGEPDLAIRVVRDIFNDDFSSLVVEGHGVWQEIAEYTDQLAPDLKERVQLWHDNVDVFTSYRIDEQLAKGLDRKVWLPSGGSLVIDRTEAMTVIDVNTGKFTGVGGTLEETVTRNNLEAAEEIVRQLRLRDIGGIVVIDFIDMVLENNRDLVLRRLVECLARDRTKHQVAEVTSLGLVQMTRKRVGQGLMEAFSVPCEECRGRGFSISHAPIAFEVPELVAAPSDIERHRSSRKPVNVHVPVLPQERSEAREAVKATLATIAAAAAHAHEHEHDHHPHPVVTKEDAMEIEVLEAEVVAEGIAE